MSKKINNGHLIEAADRVYCIQCNVESFLQDHPVFDEKVNKERAKKLKKVQKLLGELYQELGSSI